MPLSNYFQNNILDLSCFALLFIFTPITYIFEIYVVLPDVLDKTGYLILFLHYAGLFAMFNILCNALACMFVHSTIRGEILQPPREFHSRREWGYCDKCEVMIPPRCRHCSQCNICILKRDHHCFFTASCIGHRNHRYFIWFLVYICIGSGIVTYYNSYYFWILHSDVYANPNTVLEVILPMLMFVFKASWENFYLIIYDLNVIAFLYSFTMIIYHIPFLISGRVLNEKCAPDRYDLGIIGNLKMAMGDRFHLTWMSPFVKSTLPHDGVHWEYMIPYKRR